jgi:S-adenosylmethionine synthetase
VSIRCDTFGTGRVAESVLTEIIREVFDLRPGRIVEQLALKRPIFRATAAYGHFGRDGDGFRWERLDHVDQLKSAAATRSAF